MKQSLIGLLVLLLVCSCDNEISISGHQQDLDAIAESINGVWLNLKDKTDTTFFYFEKCTDQVDEFDGLISHDFTIMDNGFTINRLHEDRLALYKRNDSTYISFTPFFGETTEVHIVSIDNNFLKLGDGSEFMKVRDVKL